MFFCFMDYFRLAGNCQSKAASSNVVLIRNTKPTWMKKDLKHSFTKECRFKALRESRLLASSGRGRLLTQFLTHKFTHLSTMPRQCTCRLKL